MSLESRFSHPGLYEASCFGDTSSQFAYFMGVLLRLINLIWASDWMHKCEPGTYKLVLFSFTALPAAGSPAQLACPLCCDFGRDDTLIWFPS